MLLSSHSSYYYERQAENKIGKAVSSVYEFIEMSVLALVSVLMLFSLIISGTKVSGMSMYPTFSNDDRLLAVPIYGRINRGDIVLFERHAGIVSDINIADEGKTLVKRVIAIEGDTIDIDFTSGTVYLNGAVLDEPYIYELTTRVSLTPTEFPLTVEKGHIFVMGDNRNNSDDSRNISIGQVDVRYISKRVIARFWPTDKFKLL
ncbi:MAG: signal peptidase I [Oscillospiraceae bacterium]|nr:signal peptidase I [Oscillospiraceae bacterium]